MARSFTQTHTHKQARRDNGKVQRSFGTGIGTHKRTEKEKEEEEEGEEVEESTLGCDGGALGRDAGAKGLDWLLVDWIGVSATVDKRA